ncbi:MAG: DUF3267 domain-containing protein [Erysipelotrichaceae bacterium]|nr:DUF3267 domain-containing protein [Erysipelotrichaceae bacterium]
MTEFHFAGRYNGDPTSLPSHEPVEGAVIFKEAEDQNKLAIIMNSIAILIAVVTFGIYFYRGRCPLNMAGIILSLVALVPHEFLHAICFEGKVYMYENLRKGMLFVTGPGSFSKAGFIFMSMLPNLVFGFIPFIIFLIDPAQTLLGSLGAISIPSGAGDYYNAFNALTQMPKGSRTYLYNFRSYWYMPKENEK